MNEFDELFTQITDVTSNLSTEQQAKALIKLKLLSDGLKEVIEAELADHEQNLTDTERSIIDRMY